MGNTFFIGGDDPELYSITDNIVRTDRNIPLDDAIKLADHDPMWATRGRAIQSYAQLEQALCHVFSATTGVEMSVAGHIIFRIASYGARNAIIEKMIHHKHGQKFNLFWNPLLKDIRTVDLRRNEIVHWICATNATIGADNKLYVGVTLVPPNFWGNTPSVDRITSRDLVAFIEKCNVFARLLSMFMVVTSGKMEAEKAAPWLDIFQQPLVYPLPADHLLNRTPQASEIQPRPSPG